MEKKYSQGKNDLWSGIVISLFAAFYDYMAFTLQIPNMLTATKLNAASVPKLWGILLLILGIFLIIRGVRKMNAAKAEGYDAKSATGSTFGSVMHNNKMVIAMFVVLFVYILLMKSVGFLIDTVVFLFLEFCILSRKEERKYVLNAILAIVFGVGIYAMFVYGFKMPIPQGILKGIF